MTVTKEQLFKLADDFAKEVPVFGGKVKKLLHEAIESDSIDHNGVSDVIQALTIGEATINSIGKITNSIDIPKAKAQIEAFEGEIVKDKALLLEGLAELELLAQAIEKFTGKK